MGRQERKTYMKTDGFSELVERMQVPSIPQPYIPPIAPGIAEMIATNRQIFQQAVSIYGPAMQSMKIVEPILRASADVQPIIQAILANSDLLNSMQHLSKKAVESTRPAPASSNLGRKPSHPRRKATRKAFRMSYKLHFTSKEWGLICTFASLLAGMMPDGYQRYGSIVGTLWVLLLFLVSDDDEANAQDDKDTI